MIEKVYTSIYKACLLDEIKHLSELIPDDQWIKWAESRSFHKKDNEYTIQELTKIYEELTIIVNNMAKLQDFEDSLKELINSNLKEDVKDIISKYL